MPDPKSGHSAPGPLDVVAAMGLAPLGDSEFRLLRDLIFEASGITLSDSKTQLVASRLARRLRAHGLTRYRDYYELVMRDGPQGAEMREMLNAITTNKTDFFRESHHFDFMRSTFFGEVIARARANGERRLRIWSAGCSTGEEPYTLAMTIRSSFPAPAGWRFEIVATDLDTAVLERARNGVYAEETIAPVPDELARRFFRRGTGANAGKVRVTDELRDMVTFQQLNFVQPPWSVQGPFDLILCRNVMIYFNLETQQRIVEGFAERLRPDGYLFIGHSETLNGMAHLFDALRGTIYRRRGRECPPAPPARASAPPPTAETASPPQPSIARTEAPAASPPPRARERSGDDRVLERVNLIIGGVRASREPMRLRTVLGSCVCACLFDPGARIGGINHFMLPDGLEDRAMPARFGVNAMEMLINAMLKLGADRRRIVAKAFGAAHVLSDVGLAPDVPRKNAKFIKEFLETERIPLLSSRLGGSAPVEVLFTTDTGKALVRALGDAVARDLAREETRHDLEIRKQLIVPQAGSVELF